MAPRTPLDKAREGRSLPEARVALLRSLGRSLTTVADKLGVNRSYVSRVNSGARSGTRRRARGAREVEREIARQLGLPIHDAFPERYSRNERAA